MRTSYRNTAEADGVNKLKNGGIGADPQGKRQYRDKRKPGTEAKHPKAITQILPQ